MNPAYVSAVFAWEGELPSSFVIITAYHQHGRISPDSRNKHQDATLKSVLSARGLNPVRVVGMSPDASHQEPSWAVRLEEPAALELGRVFKQEAIFIVREGALSVVKCSQKQKAGEVRELSMGAWPSEPNAPITLEASLAQLGAGR